MNLRNIAKLFNLGDCCVVGEKGSGKDMLVANVIARRKLPYVSNVKYDRKGVPLDYYEFDYSKLDVSGNTYKDFINDTLKPYEYPYPVGADVYISDVGVYFPAQYCNELNKEYKNLAVLLALSRHLGFRVHTNCQNLGRIYDKIREHARRYIMCLKCRVIPLGKKNQLVIQKIRVYEKYQSCADNIPKLHLPFTAYISGDITMCRLYKLNYEIQHGKINEYTLIYFNRSNYDTHIFKQKLSPKESDFLEMLKKTDI